MTRSRSTLISAIAVFVVLSLWFLVTETSFVASNVLPSPIVILKELIRLSEVGYAGTPLYQHVAASLIRTFVGFSIGVLLAIPIGLAIGYNDLLYAIVSPFLAVLRPIPVIAYIPLVILWFGIGEFPKILLIAITAFLYVSINAAAGVKSVNVDLVRAAQSLGVNQRQMFMNVVLPGSLPYIFAGLRIGAAVSWAVVVAAELVAAQRGLGYVIMDAATFFRIPSVYVGVLLIGLIGFVIDRLINVAERRLIHWQSR
jgi:NitT/TauT family transport system permease protein